MSDTWKTALMKGLAWMLGVIFTFALGFAVRDRVSLGATLDDQGTRLTRVEATYVTRSILNDHEDAMEELLRTQNAQIIQCLNRIQRNQTCDF